MFQVQKVLGTRKTPIGLLASSSVRLDTSVPKGYRIHISIGKVSCNAVSVGKEVHILRDTGALQSVILRFALPDDFVEVNSEYVLLGGFPNTISSYPREKMYLESEWSKGTVQLAVADTMPIGRVEVVIANDIAEGEIINNPVIESMTGNESPMEFVDDRAESPICVVIRARAKAIDLSEVDLDIGTDTVFSKNDELIPEIKAQAGWKRDSLKVGQEKEFREKECISIEPKEFPNQ